MRCSCHFFRSTLRVPTLAGDGWLIAQTLAIGAAIFRAIRYRTFATGMCARLGFLLGHNSASCLLGTTFVSLKAMIAGLSES